MNHTLITVLGRGQARSEGQGRRRYERVDYDFGDGKLKATEFFGLALAEHIRPDRLVILGTPGSMWDVLLFSLDLGTAHDDALLELTGAADAECVHQEQLDALAPLVGQRLGYPVQLRLIPYGRSPQEQIEILKVMAATLERGETATLDITHGFRHLPMLIQMSALYLRRTLDVVIEGVYYGALELTPRGQPKPVMNLRGLLDIADWVEALSTFDKDGDYSVFVPRLERDGLAPVEAAHLRRAAFFERSSNARDAAKELANFGKVLDRGLPGIGTLFAEPLRERTQWQRGRESNTYAQQRHLARVYLDKGDYIRAAIFAYEAFVTRLVERDGGAVVHYWDRDVIAKSYEDDRTVSKQEKNDYKLLKKLRNTLAHGNESTDDRVPGIVGKEERLRKELSRLIRSLLD